MSETKLATFLTSKKVADKRLLAVSHDLETLRPEDRSVKLQKRQAKKAEGGGEKKDLPKPRSGRAVTPRALVAAKTGKTISGPTKQRILRAVNAILETKKLEAVQLRDLF